MISAKNNFQQSPHAKIWADAIASDWFQSAVQAALLNIDLGTIAAPTMELAAANHYRREGAAKFIESMYALLDKPPESFRPSMPANLKPVK